MDVGLEGDAFQDESLFHSSIEFEGEKLYGALSGGDHDAAEWQHCGGWEHE